MRVDGPSRPPQTNSSEGVDGARQSEASEKNVVDVEEQERRKGHDMESSFDAGPRAPAWKPPPPPPPPPEPPPVPAKELRRGDSGPEVEQLQQSLVKLGYLTEQQVATGPGVFGPRTESALQRFQQEHGVASSGKYAAPTREALAQALSASASTGGGASGAALSAREAFITQFTSEYNPHGPRGSTNCGPASLAMSLAYTGHMPPGLTKEQQVDYARALMSPRRASEFTHVQASDGTRVPQLNRDHELTGGTMVGDGIKGAGLTSRYGQGWEALDKQLAAGNPVIANGYTNAAWRSQFPQRMGSGDIGHLNAILGRTADGKYLVADPLHTGGPVAMTRAQLGVFFSPTGGVPSFNALEGASRPSAAPSTSNLLPSLPQGLADLPLPQGLPTDFSRVRTTGASGTTGASTDVQARATQDAQGLANTLKTSLQDAATKLEGLIAGNPDPAYREALLKAAEPSLTKMGELFGAGRHPPEIERQLHPPPPQRPPDLNDFEVVKKLAAQEQNAKYQTFYSLARTAEQLNFKGSELLGAAFSRNLPVGVVTQGPMKDAVRMTIQSGIGSRLALGIEKKLASGTQVSAPNTPTDATAIHEAIWGTIDRMRVEFSTVADKVEQHHKKLAEVVGGLSPLLSEQQKQAAISKFMEEGGRGTDEAIHQQLSKALAQALPDCVPGGGIDDPRMTALARELPRLGETQSGAEYLAEALAQKAEGLPVFIDVAAKLKDGRDFNEKLSTALVKAAGMGAIAAVSAKNGKLADAIFKGLTEYAPLVGMKPDSMDRFVGLLRSIGPDTREDKVKERLAKALREVRDAEPGLSLNPDSPAGKMLGTLAVAATTVAAIGDASQWGAQGRAGRIKIVGDSLSAGVDVTTTVLDFLGKGATLAKKLKVVGAVGGMLGAVADGMESINAVKEGKFGAATAAGLQSVGGAILAASAVTSVTPGLQLLGAGLFVAGLVVKFIDPDQRAIEGAQRELLVKMGFSEQQARHLVGFGPEFLNEKLIQGAGMSPEQVQAFVKAHPEIGGNKGYLDSLSQGAAAFGMTGPNYQEFLERLARANGGEGDLNRLGMQVHELFFMHPPQELNGQRTSQAQLFRRWVEDSFPDVARWAKQALPRAS